MKLSKIKKGLGIILTLAMVINAIEFNQIEINAAKAKAKLSSKKMTLTVGQKRIISLKNKLKKATYTYKSNKTKFATVNKKGKVSAKKKGRVIITVKEIVKVKVKKKTKKKTSTVGKVTVTISDATVKKSTTAPATLKPTATTVPKVTVAPTATATATATATVAASPKPSPTISAKPSPTISPSPSPTQMPPVYASYVSPDSEIELDGDIDDAWDTAQEIVPSILLPENSTSDTKVKYKVLWDKEALFVLAIVEKAELDDSSSDNYQKDSVEVFLDEDNCKIDDVYQDCDLQVRVNFKNERSGRGDWQRVESATSLTESGFISEIRVPFRESTKPSIDKRMGFDLQYNDAENGQRVSTWNVFDDTGQAFQNPSKMGTIILKPEPEAPQKPLSIDLSDTVNTVQPVGEGSTIHWNEEEEDLRVTTNDTGRGMSVKITIPEGLYLSDFNKLTFDAKFSKEDQKKLKLNYSATTPTTIASTSTWEGPETTTAQTTDWFTYAVTLDPSKVEGANTMSGDIYLGLGWDAVATDGAADFRIRNLELIPVEGTLPPIQSVELDLSTVNVDSIYEDEDYECDWNAITGELTVSNLLRFSLPLPAPIAVGKKMKVRVKGTYTGSIDFFRSYLLEDAQVDTACSDLQQWSGYQSETPFDLEYEHINIPNNPDDDSVISNHLQFKGCNYNTNLEKLVLTSVEVTYLDRNRDES